MADFRFLLVSLMALTYLTSFTLGRCPDDSDVGLHTKIHDAPIAVVGYAREKIPDQRFKETDVFSVNFDVKCIYMNKKKVDIDAMITVNEVGEVPDVCPITDIAVTDKIQIIFLKKEDGKFTPTSSGQTIQLDAEKGELIGVCDYVNEFPKGMPDAEKKELDASETCEFDPPKADPEDEEGCYNPSEDDAFEEKGPVGPSPSPETTAAPKKPEDNKTGTSPAKDDTDKSTEDKDMTPEDKPVATENRTVEVTVDDKNDNGQEVPYQPATGEEGDDDDDGNGTSTTFASFALLLITILSVILL